jgi:ParB-like chromosome segregation protein Spo0J
MANNTKESDYEVWNLADLKPHPKQAELFGDLPPAIFDELKRDIEINGLMESIEILPDGTIISGHQRRRALIEMGAKTSEVWVHHDLASADKFEIERIFLTANTARRQLSKLAQVRIMIRRFEILRRSSIHYVTAHECSELRKQIASELQMTERNAGRYLAVLRAPRIVQDFFESEQLTLQHAAKVATLSEKVQAEIAEALPYVENPKGFLKAYFGAIRKPAHVRQALQKYLAELEHAMADISQDLDSVETVCFEDVELLREGMEFHQALIDRVEQNEFENEELFNTF